MPSWRRPPGARDADAEVAYSGRGEEADVSLTEAEEELARADARAAEARARLMLLREQAGLPNADDTDEIAVNYYSDDYYADEIEAPYEEPHHRRRPQLQRPGWKASALAAAFVVIGASLGGSVFMELEHRAIVRKQHQHAEFAAAAREGVTRLMSIDADHAKEDIQRSIDNSTGELRDQLQRTAVARAQKAEESRISTRVIVDAVAVESTTDDSGIILVAARSDNVYPDNGKREMQSWRISVNLSRVGGQLKMAKVDFLR